MPDRPADPTRTQTAPEPPPAVASPTVTGSTASQPNQVSLGQDPCDTPQLGPPTHPGDLGRLGRYRVLKRLGAGGMGEVYLAHDDTLDRRVALKIMLPRFAVQPIARQRFLREARTAAAVRSDHVVAILDVDEVGGVPFIAMEYLQGIPLDRYLSANPGLSVALILRFGMEAARGLAAAHEQGLVHRDIKPGNLFLEAPHGRLKILDFGLAKETDRDADDGDVTRTGQVVGTPAYMSPEQARGSDLDHRTDLFSLGVVFYKLCTGRQPFRGPNAMAVAMAIGTDDPTPVRELNPTIPEALAALVHRLLAKKPADRPQTAAEVHAALVAIEDAATIPEGVAVPAGEAWGLPGEVPEAVPEPTEATEPPSRRPAARGGFPWLIAGSAVAALLSVGVLLAVLNRGKPNPEVAKGAPPPPAVPPKVAPPVAPKVDADRAAARWVLSYPPTPGGVPGVTIRRAGAAGDEWVTDAAKLPPDEFRVVSVFFPWEYQPTDADLDHLLDLPALTSITFRRSTITDAGLEKLSRFPAAGGYERIAIGSANLTNDAIAHLARFPALTELRLGGSKVTATGLAELAQLQPNLAALHIDGVALPDADMGVLRQFKKLQTLSLSFPPATAEGLREVGQLPDLRRLFLIGSGCTDDVLAALPGLPELLRLQLGDTAVSDAGLEKLIRFKATLKQVEIIGVHRATAAGLDNLRATLPGCTVEGSPYDPDRDAAAEFRRYGADVVVRLPDRTTRKIDPAGQLPNEDVKLLDVNFRTKPFPPGYGKTFVDHVAGLSEFRLVYDQHKTIILSEADMIRLAGGACRESLENLDIRNVLTPATLTALKGCPKLYHLFTDASKTDDALLARLPELAAVGKLGLEHLGRSGKVTAKGLTAIGTMPLTGFTLKAGRLTVDEFTVLADGLTGVTSLGLTYTRNVGELLPVVVAKFPKLTYLDLSDTPLTDADLVLLHGHKTLRWLAVRSTPQLTAEGLQKLREALPKLSVQGGP